MGKPKTVLVVDDERPIRDLMQALVRHIGHTVETAANATEALSKIEAKSFDLVFTDLVMPGMQGDELAAEIKKLRPNLPVVLVTGHKPTILPPAIALILGKPFSREDVRQAIATLT